MADQHSYARWRHGGWYVEDVIYPSGAVGCVSRNYLDRKWRIACDDRPDAYELFTYPNRTAAADAEAAIVAALVAVAVRCPTCGDYEERHARDRAWCYGCGTACAEAAAAVAVHAALTQEDTDDDE